MSLYNVIYPKIFIDNLIYSIFYSIFKKSTKISWKFATIYKHQNFTNTIYYSLIWEIIFSPNTWIFKDNCSVYFFGCYYKRYYYIKLGGARGVMVIVTGYGHGDTSSIPGKTDCISHSTNTLGKGMNPIILPPAMGK